MLAIRRIIFYLIRKFEAKDAQPKLLTDNLSTVQGFASSGLMDSDSCPWLSGVPDYVMEVVQFVAKLLRHSKAFLNILGETLQKDPVASAEARACFKFEDTNTGISASHNMI